MFPAVTPGSRVNLFHGVLGIAPNEPPTELIKKGQVLSDSNSAHNQARDFLLTCGIGIVYQVTLVQRRGELSPPHCNPSRSVGLSLCCDKRNWLEPIAKLSVIFMCLTVFLSDYG